MLLFFTYKEKEFPFDDLLHLDSERLEHSNRTVLVLDIVKRAESILIVSAVHCRRYQIPHRPVLY